MCAANPAGECTSAYSNEAIATAYTFIAAPAYEDSTLVGAPAGTVIKRAHVAQLRVGATRGVGASGGGGGGGTTGGVRWMVADQLGTPRMTIDLSGALSGVRRRDFLPFGEELTVGGRTSAQGYAADNSRFKFTTYERDGESGLDFAQARYYASSQGRFTRGIPFVISPHLQNQTLLNFKKGDIQYVVPPLCHVKLHRLTEATSDCRY